MTRTENCQRWIIVAGVLGSSWSSQCGANEALDYLEGKISDDEVSASQSSRPEPSEVLRGSEGDSEASGTRSDRDYSSRWKNRLVPQGVIFDKPNNPVVQRVAIEGLAEWGLVAGDVGLPSGGDQDVNDSQLRRLRIGGIVRAFYNTDLEGRVVADGDGYQGIETLKATIPVGEGLVLEGGKFRPPFSQEYRQDPSVRVAPDLSPIVALIAPANTIGARVSAGYGPWDFGVGWFSGSQGRGLPAVNRQGFVLGNLAYTFDGAGTGGEGSETVTGHQRWHLDYLYNFSEDPDGSIPNSYRHLLSTGIEVSHGDFDFAGDFLLANGATNTAWGLALTGRYWVLEDALRMVGRYNYADSDALGGVAVGFGVPGALGDSTQPLAGYQTVLTGDEFHSVYLGLDWHFLKDSLVLSTGVEWRLLKDENTSDNSGFFWQTGGRAAF